MRYFSLLTALFLWMPVFGQPLTYPAISLPDSMTANADAVIRLAEKTVEVTSAKKMTITSRQVITILNKAGDHHGHLVAFYDPSIKIKKINVQLYNQLGLPTGEKRAKDFTDVSAVDGGTLYSESRIKFMKLGATSYPYTLDYTLTYETPNTAFLPSWTPLADERTSVEKSVYHISAPADLTVRTREHHFEGFPVTTTGDGTTRHYELINMPARKSEDLSPPAHQWTPHLITCLNTFHLEGVDGSGANWNDLGQWQYDHLLAGRGKLPQSTIDKVNQLVAGVDEPREKARLIYQYVQDNTRYISVQLGIGGWQPIVASSVDQMKYGDCKGLTNYTMALLKTQGITAHYAVVYAGRGQRDVHPEFASMQGNHVILNVPMEDEDIWLECTSQSLPFNFLGDFTDDRNVLLVTPDGGQIKRTPAYTGATNKCTSTGNFTLSPDGTLAGDLTVHSTGLQYDGRYRLAELSRDDLTNRLKDRWSKVNGLEIASAELTDDKRAVALTENLQVKAPDYARKAGTDLLLAPNAFDRNTFIPDRYSDRSQPFQITRGYLDTCSFTLTLPTDFSLQELPEPLIIEGPFGSYSRRIERGEGGVLLYNRRLLVNKGRWSKEQYADFRSFLRKVAKADKQKVILSNKS